MPMESEQAHEDDLTPDARAALESGAIHPEPEDAGDDSDYGRKVKKRINKEVSKRKKLEERLQAQESESERMRRELKEARERLSSYEEREDEGLKSKAEDLQARRDKALDEGELGEYNKLNDQLMQIKIDQVQRRTAQRKEPEPDEKPAKPAKPNVTQATQDWVARNGEWLNDEPEKAAEAVRIEKQLQSEGYSLDDDDLYEELDRRLAAKEKTPADDFLDDYPAPRAGATAGVVRDSVNRQPRSRPGALTREDLSRMQRAGFDPNNAEHRAGWLKRNDPIQ